jgi:hypothetical protein
MENFQWAYAILAMGLGFLAAFAELLSRYQDPKQILTTGSSIIYMLINGVASFLAYWFIDNQKFTTNEITKVIVAGTSALVLLRSSLASIKVGEKQVEAGFASILQVFLTWADRSFDQRKARADLPDVKPMMAGIDFEKAKLALPTTCFKIMKNVTQEEQDKIASEVAILTQSSLDNNVKCINLGILLMELTGAQLLNQAIDVLGGSITGKQEDDLTKLDALLNKFK